MNYVIFAVCGGVELVSDRRATRKRGTLLLGIVVTGEDAAAGSS